jgi:hypothetical protein
VPTERQLADVLLYRTSGLMSGLRLESARNHVA